MQRKESGLGDLPIQNTVEEDQMVERIGMKEYIDSFTGETEKEGK